LYFYVMSDILPKVIIEINHANDLSGLMLAASQLGGISVRTLEDPAEAHARLLSMEIVSLGRKYPEESAETLMHGARTIWPATRVAEYIGPSATHRVTELTFMTPRYDRRSLKRMATHGYTEGDGGYL
jgi:hypothetical protein